MITKNCEYCGEVFHTKLNKTRYCSISCGKKGKPSWSSGIKGVLKAYNKGLTKKDLPSLGNSGVKKGNIPWNKGVPMKESTKNILSTARKGKKISPATQFKPGATPWNKDRKCPETSGPNNARWKGGKADINSKMRTSFEYRYWRKSCLKRDNFTCQKTSISGGELQVHHINNFAEFPELMFDISNGITLSKKSHIQFHKNMVTKITLLSNYKSI